MRNRVQGASVTLIWCTGAIMHLPCSSPFSQNFHFESLLYILLPPHQEWNVHLPKIKWVRRASKTPDRLEDE